MLYICDNGRHLICLPYSIANLHRMAYDLGIHRDWFHQKEGRWHYDIPKRRIKEIQDKCQVVDTRTILEIMELTQLNPEWNSA